MISNTGLEKGSTKNLFLTLRNRTKFNILSMGINKKELIQVKKGSKLDARICFDWNFVY